LKLLAQFLSLTLSALLISGPVSAQAEAALQIKVVDNQSEAGLTVQVTDATGAPIPDAAVVVRMPETGPSGTFADGTRSLVVYTNASGAAAIAGIHWGAEPGTSSIRVTATRGTSHAGILLEHVIQTAGPAAPPSPAPSAHLQPAVVELPAISEPVSQAKAIPPPQPGVPETKPVSSPQIHVENTAPRVSVVNAPTHEKIRGSGSSKKWILIAVIAAGAGAGFAMAGKGKSSSSSTPSTGITIGGPTVSVGNP
jgi:hypothetical protein